jgi:hypothetical protein
VLTGQILKLQRDDEKDKSMSHQEQYYGGRVEAGSLMGQRIERRCRHFLKFNQRLGQMVSKVQLRREAEVVTHLILSIC